MNEPKNIIEVVDQIENKINKHDKEFVRLISILKIYINVMLQASIEKDTALAKVSEVLKEIKEDYEEFKELKNILYRYDERDSD